MKVFEGLDKRLAATGERSIERVGEDLRRPASVPERHVQTSREGVAAPVQARDHLAEVEQERIEGRGGGGNGHGEGRIARQPDRKLTSSLASSGGASSDTSREASGSSRVRVRRGTIDRWHRTSHPGVLEGPRRSVAVANTPVERGIPVAEERLGDERGEARSQASSLTRQIEMGRLA